MTEEEKNPPISLINKTLYFTSLKNSSFDYSLPIKKSLTKFSSGNRIEASPYLFEYLCYKITENKLSQIQTINEEISIISEKYLSSEISNKSDSIKKKYVFVPIRNAISRKWNAVIFIHLEKQITQYMNQMNEEPIIAKIISSNINSEEDDYILNTTMDRIESTFNFSSPEDIQFEVDSINISDQPNTSIFLLNFIEGLIEQKTDEDIMNYIMKLYDESSNTNIIGANNYFMSFNKDNELFKNILPTYENEVGEFMKNRRGANQNEKDGEKFCENEEEIDSEEEALKIIAKENEEIRKQMEEQEIVFNMKINDPNYRLESDEYKNRNNILGQIQEVDNESEDESDKKSNINNKSLKLTKSLRKKSENNIFNDEKIKNSVKENLSDLNEFNNIKISENSNVNQNEKNENILSNKVIEKDEHKFNKEESIEFSSNIIVNNNQNIDIKNDIDNNDNKKNDNDEQNIKSEDSNEIKEENIIIIKSDNTNMNNNNQENKNENINDKKEEENEKEKENDIEKEDVNKSEEFDKKIIISTVLDNNDENKNKEIKEEIKEIKENKEIKINNDIKNVNIDIKESSEIQKNKDKEDNSNNNIEKNDINSFEQINIPKAENKTIEINSSDINIKNTNIKDMHNSIRDSLSSNNASNSVYEKKKIYQKRNSFGKSNINNDDNNNNHNYNKYNNTNFYISKGGSNENKENSNKNNYNDINSNQNNKKNIIFNKKNNIGIYKPNLPLVKKNNNKDITNENKNSINKNNNENSIYNKGNINYNKFDKNTNTIIINELANNKTVINIIGIKNNYKPNDTKQENIQNNKYENKSDNNNNNIINNQNQIWNINISNHNKINLINKENEENEYITKIPDDGTINRVSSTLCANNSISGINNNQEKAYKTISYLNNIENKNKLKTETDDKINKDIISKDETNNDNKSYIIFQTDNDNELNSKQDEIKLDDENNIDVNMLVNSNKNRIQRITSKKRTKGSNTYGFFKEYETSDCGLDFTKDLKCGCSGGSESGCVIF